MARLLYDWMTALMAGLPAPIGYALADLLTEIHYRAFPARRHAALANLAVILPGVTRRERTRVVRRMMRSYNRMMFEFFRLPHLSREELLAAVEVEGREHIEGCLARGHGCIVTCTHIGNWELGAVLVGLWGHRLHAVAGVQLGRWLTGAVRDTKRELAIVTVAPEDGFRKLWRALEHNDPIALMVDGDVYRHGTPVELFGRETPWPAGPGVLASRTGSPICCSYCERVAPGRFRIRIEPPLDPAAFPSIAAINARVAAISERHIREHLDQWCIFRPLWDATGTEAADAAVGARRLEA
ncbi:MAG: lysophospholipid acyltransferase family protein [Candidatus Eisenbacteria bacterium]